MRNSDPDAAVYWLARMLEAGEDPLYVARRLVRFASEDIGLADPQALTLAVAATAGRALHSACPEGNTALAQAAVYLATAPKSNAVYAAYGAAASDDAHRGRAEPVPLHLRNAPTRLMKQLGYGKGYQYAHDAADAVTGMDCLPPAAPGSPVPTADRRAATRRRSAIGWPAGPTSSAIGRTAVPGPATRRSDAVSRATTRIGNPSPSRTRGQRASAAATMRCASATISSRCARLRKLSA